tara:strand:+ start:3407 stop:3796 length:390 start_codon:yes stop_codon:yes gene_type:complete
LPSAGAGFTFTAEWRFTSLDYRRKKVIMGNKIFVGGLNWDATDDDLRETFGECGAITDAVIVNDRDTGRSRGFGFVTYSSDEEAKAAVEKFDGQDFMGRKLTVNEARQREDRGNGGGGGRSGGGRRDNW